MVYPVGKLVWFHIYKLWLRKVEGLGNISKDQPFIIAANHTSYYDAGILHSIIIPKTDRKIHAFVSSKYWKNPIIRMFLIQGECIPVFVDKEENAKRKNRIAFEKSLNYIKKGDCIEFFPEGKRSQDGKLNKAYNGIAKLALKSKASVVPIGIIDSYKVLPKGKTFPRFVRCEVKIGKPMYFDKYYNKKINEKILEEITGRIMKEIGKLIGQKYNY